MSAAEAILEQWIGKVIEEFDDQSRPLLVGEQDRFRNPVSGLVQENLAVLVAYLVDGAEFRRASASVAAIVRLLALQSEGSAKATRLLDVAEPILQEHFPGQEAYFSERLGVLAMVAAGEYHRCRDLLTTVDGNERRRAMAVPAAMAKSGIRSCL